MTQIVSVQKTVVTGEEIAPIVSKLEAAAAGENRDHVVIALLAMAVVVMYPEISSEQLQKMVVELTNYICVSLDPEVEDPDDKPTMH